MGDTSPIYIDNTMQSLDQKDSITQADFEFLSGILRQNQRNDILRVIRDQERKERQAKMQFEKTYNEKQKKTIMTQINIDKLKVQEKIAKIKEKYEDKYNELLRKANNHPKIL